LANPAKSDQRLVAALGYIFTPVVPLVAMKSEDVDPFVAKHARQALIWAVPFLVLLTLVIVAAVMIVRADFIYILLLPIVMLVPFVPGMIWAKRVYFGDDVTFPVGGGDR